MSTYETVLERFHTSGPGGFTLVSGLDVKVLSDRTTLQELLDETGIQLDFSTCVEADDQFAVPYWVGSKWIEIKPDFSEDKVSERVEAEAAKGLYEIESADDSFDQVLTSEKTGTFVLVKK